MTNDYMNSNGFYGGSQSWQTPTSQVPMYPNYGMPMNARPHTNVELVTSLEEAIIKSNIRGSDMYYIDQNKPVLYRVKVEMDGKKSYVQLPYNLPNQPESIPATKADVQALTEQLVQLKNAIGALTAPGPSTEKAPKKKKVGEVVEYDESNG